jgi:phosphate transport system substrate-binding protein
VTVDYDPAGSPAAIERLDANQGDFFTSDVPLSDVEEATMGGSDEIAQLPWASGAIAVAYNLPDVGELRLSSETLGAIFAGRIQRWDDPSVRADNPGARLPSLGVQVVYRSDPSGTTDVFSSYLQAVAPGEWHLGAGSDVRFPRGQGVTGSEAVAAAVKRTAGAVGYVQLGYAQRASLGVALLGNRAGSFLAPTAEAVDAGLVGATLRPYGTTAKLLFTPESPGAYPLATFSYLLFRRKGLDPAKATALRHFASWALREGQGLAEPLGYTPVPRQFRVTALTVLESD